MILRMSTSTVFLTWELGGGRGHLGPLRELAERLLHRGHRVCLASRNVVAAREIFADLPVNVFQSPGLPARLTNHISQVHSFVDILHNVGFGTAKDLLALAAAWSSLYEVIRPDVIVFDHSPTALAASYGYSVKRVLIGTGFACPPPGYEDSDLRSWLPASSRRGTNSTEVLKNVNLLRQQQRLPEFDSVGDLYAAVDATLLATFPELDHFAERLTGRHLGVFPLPRGPAPVWPRKARRRAFIYHKPHSHLDKLVDELTRQNVATILYTGGEDEATIRQYSTEYVSVATCPVDLPSAMNDADFAVLNGTHATTVAALLAGKPSIHYPLVLEQWMFAQRVKQIRAGLVVPANSPSPLASIIEQATSEICAGAAEFAAKYTGFDPRLSLDSAVASIESTIGDPTLHN
jgi:UDP:flavonoid glycosyltransferase YjiC (YdhE family)